MKKLFFVLFATLACLMATSVSANATPARPISLVGGGCVNHNDLYGTLRPCISISYIYNNSIASDLYVTLNSRPGCRYIKIDIVSTQTNSNGSTTTRKESPTQQDLCYNGYHIGETVVPVKGRKYFTRVWSNHLQEFRSPGVWLP